MGYLEDTSAPAGDKGAGVHSRLPPGLTLTHRRVPSRRGKVAVARGQGQSRLPAGSPLSAPSDAPPGAAGNPAGGEGVNGSGPTQQKENFIMK